MDGRGRTLLFDVLLMYMLSRSRFSAVWIAIVQNWLCTKRRPSKTEFVVLRMTKLIGRPGLFETPCAYSYLTTKS